MVVAQDMLNKIFELNEIAKKQALDFPKKREAYNQIKESGKTFVGIAGLRGIGKTTILKQLLLENKDAMYISLDTLTNIDLFEIAKTLNDNYNVKLLLLDEINYYKNWKVALKNIYDFTNIKVYFTSSVAIDIINSKTDLSRRAIIKNICPFSFREFIYFNKNKPLDKLTINDINNLDKLKEINKYDYLFEEYISGGNIPTHINEKNPQIFKNILEKILEKDLTYALNFNGEDILNVKNILEFVANSGIDDISYSNIAKNIGINKYKAIKYVTALEKAFVLNVVKPIGTNVTKEPKIMFVPPFRLCYLKKDFKEVIGQLREEFFVESAKINNISIFYLKGNRGEKKPDYTATINKIKYVFEIGGKNKTRTQILEKENKAERYILVQPTNIFNPYRPLIFFGFL